MMRALAGAVEAGAGAKGAEVGETVMVGAAAVELAVGLAVEPGVELKAEPGPVVDELAEALRFELPTNSIRARRRRTNSSGE